MKSLHINHPLCKATILEQGAQLIDFQPTGEAPLLWSAELSTYCEGKPFRGGIPICWPWFGKGQIPSHGFARIMPWELESRDECEDGVRLRWILRDSDATRAIWPHSFALTLDMHLSSKCTMTLQIDAPIETTGALHTYLFTDDVGIIQIEGLGDQYIDALDDGKIVKTDEKILIIKGNVDRIYTHSLGNNLLIGRDKILQVTHYNYSDIVVWNPWSEGVMRLSDMAENDYQKMICVETARILKPFGKRDTLGLVICKLK
ncbi:MAG: D-hexose-6-phosphate mutarotase [Campylobacterales bacterium]|nr:D-hexose-6-phosphate mutarotase [Campylobacterales bacterium]